MKGTKKTDFKNGYARTATARLAANASLARRKVPRKLVQLSGEVRTVTVCVKDEAARLERLAATKSY